MAFKNGGQIPTNGLIFAVDFGSDRSWVSGSSTVYDLSGNNSTSTLVTASAYTESFNGGMVFNGSATRVDYGANTTLRPDNITLIAVAKYTQPGTQTVSFIGGDGNTGYNGYWIGVSGGKFKFGVGNSFISASGAAQSTIDDVDEILHMLGGTFDGSSIKTYMDGQLRLSTFHETSGPLDYTSLSGGFRLGNIEGTNIARYWSGVVYTYFIYDRALSETEMEDVYKALKPRFDI